ncbi:MAG: 3-oxoacyl-[acyl-carrier-protein] reductase [Chitinophagales bacterium]|nr:3-oxoacyl-[acyl-carrier-protein] reductase [Chitinophagales bacterium]
MKLLSGKTTIITGGAKGIGRGIATKFAEQGSNIVFTYFSSEQKAQELTKELEQFGIEVMAVKSDASNFQAAKELTDLAVAKFGKIDVLINNAGITRDNLLMRMSEEQWDEVILNNLKSTFNLTKHVSTQMLRQKYGSIINISSIVGLKGQAGQTNYAASKAGMIGFSKSVADELGSRNIRCNCIAPGFIETDMTDELPEDLKKKYFEQIPLKKFGTAEDVANSCVFLGSDMSKYITGQVISVCGGLSR